MGIFREYAPLEDAWIKIKNLKERYQYSFVRTKESRFNAELRAALELEPMLDVAEIIISCALARKESRGAHKRVDHPDRDDENWLKHSLAQFTLQGTKLYYEPPVITHYQPTERTY